MILKLTFICKLDKGLQMITFKKLLKPKIDFREEKISYEIR